MWSYSPTPSRRRDTDHTVAFAVDEDGRPAEPGQTRIDNLGGLERRLHRVETFNKGLRVYQPQRGVYLWRSPHGHWYRVDDTGTHRLGKHPHLTATTSTPRLTRASAARTSAVNADSARAAWLAVGRGVDVRMLVHERPRLVVQALDVGLQLAVLDSPLPAPAELDGGQIAAAHQRVHLGG